MSDGEHENGPERGDRDLTPAERYAEPRYFEDIAVGDSARFGAYEVTEAEIVEYAERYDPQPFHTDPDHAEQADAFFDSVVAPGWLTAGLSQRLLVEHYFPSMHNVAASGCDEVRWPRPVTPGDTLTCRVEVLATEPHREERGTVDIDIELSDAGDEQVFGAIGHVIVRRQPG